MDPISQLIPTRRRETPDAHPPSRRTPRPGRPVTVRSANGELTGIAKVDDSIRRGAVSIPHGHHAANVNRLTNKDDIDVVTGMVRYSGIAVSLHPA